jgi:hypothetical protein
MTRKPVNLTFKEPDGIDMPAIIDMHPDGEGERGKGAVLFSKDEKLRPFAAMTPGDLASLLPGLLPEFDTDSFYTLSRFKSPPKGRLHPGYAKTDNVSHLTTAWVDIDYHTAPGGALELWQVMADVLRAVERGAIPSPSVYVNSGRGLWLLWRIHPVELATPAARDLLVRINKAAAAMFAKVGADSRSTNVSRWTRIPGSVNSKAGKRCTYLFAGDEQGQPIYYTLPELAEAFNVAECPVPKVFSALRPERRLRLERVDQATEKNPVNVAKGHRGQAQLNVNTAAALTHLATLRGGYRKSTRNIAAFYLSIYLHRAGHSQPEIYALLSSPGTFVPPLSEERKAHHMKAGREFKNIRTPDGGKSVRYQTIADALQITPDESRAIQECIGKPFPHAYQNQLAPAPPKQTREERREARRDRIAGMIAGTPGGLSEREVLRRLQAEGFDVSSPETIHGDLVARGLNRPRPERSRPAPPPALPFE